MFFTFEVEEEGGFRRVPEVGFENFLWASDFPGLDSPWPHSKVEGHAPVEAVLGKKGLDLLVFQNAVRLTKYQLHPNAVGRAARSRASIGRFRSVAARQELVLDQRKHSEEI